ncbi:hypothetical protein E8E14_013321 [Neopestalotiopsis sp. 37M]|nr:hypothetical protein E8E14_013321 [Neopestalotiopsis sp. 37M]
MYINYSHENVSDIHTWDSWSKACSALRSHVKRIRCLSLWYQDGPMSDPANDYLCFVIRNGYYRDFDPGGSYKNFVEPEQRVGYDDTDWSQAQEVLGCVRRTVNRLKPRFTNKQSRRRLLVKVAKALSEFARHCGGGEDLWIELICDREQYDTDMEDDTGQEDVC